MKTLLFAILFSTLVNAQGNPNFPITIHVLWDMNPDADNVLSYAVRIDANDSIIYTPDFACVADTRTCSAPLVIGDNNPHTVAVTATNSWGTSDPATVTFRVNNPKKPTNIRIGV